MTYPTLACPNFLSDVDELKRFALDNGFQGIDWSFPRDNAPLSRDEESDLVDSLSILKSLEVRYHFPLNNSDLGDENSARAARASAILRRVCRLVSKVGGRYLTIHIGLGRNSTEELSWERTVGNLGAVVQFANNLGVRICLENLDWGWTGRPHLFEKLIRKTGCWATLDIGHARLSRELSGSAFEIEDFTLPHPERFRNAHVYHEQSGDDHTPPNSVVDLEDRLNLLMGLTLCRWWVLEVRDAAPLLQCMNVVREFLEAEFAFKGRSGAYPR